jgi:hypothetical protein
MDPLLEFGRFILHMIGWFFTIYGAIAAAKDLRKYMNA